MNSISNPKMIQAKEWIKQAEHIIIGAGAGLSTAGGIEYSGKRFLENFQDFIQKYSFTDMYTSSFYEFETEEEKWAYWAKHIDVNDIQAKPAKLYQELFELIQQKDYFVITTNVDGQFLKAGFEPSRVFEVQGSYRYLQCSKGCHDTLYDSKEKVNKWIKCIKDCKIPTEEIPKCPICGGPMEVNLRKDAYFVQDKKWYQQNKVYENFLKKAEEGNTLLLELGVGFNTPGIIRFPFEKMILENEKWRLIRINQENADTYLAIENKTISFQEDIKEVLEKVKEGKENDYQHRL